MRIWGARRCNGIGAGEGRKVVGVTGAYLIPRKLLTGSASQRISTKNDTSKLIVLAHGQGETSNLSSLPFPIGVTVTFPQGPPPQIVPGTTIGVEVIWEYGGKV